MIKTPAPPDEVQAAVLDAVVIMASEDGSVARNELEQNAIRREAFANLAWSRYQTEHPELRGLTNGQQYQAITEGLMLLGAEAVAWLVSRQHLAVADGSRITLGVRPIMLLPSDGGKKRQPYAPGRNHEADIYAASARRITENRKRLILQSIESLGDLRDYFPVIEGEDGDIVDGHHRRAIDPTWPASRQRVPREQRLAVRIAANRSSNWTDDDYKRLVEQATPTLGPSRAKREAARLALLEDHERSNREIARLTGADGKTVADVRDELEEIAEIPQFRSVAGRTRKDGTPAQPRSAPSNKITDTDIARINESFSGGSTESEVATQFGISKSTANKYRNLWKASQLPPTTSHLVLVTEPPSKPPAPAGPGEESVLDLAALGILHRFQEGTADGFANLLQRHLAGDRVSGVGLDCLESLAELLHRLGDTVGQWVTSQR